MVNFEVIDTDVTNNSQQITFKSITARKFFTLQLVDFLSLPSLNVFRLSSLKKLNISDNCLGHLHYLYNICEHPQFNSGNLEILKTAVDDFSAWLVKEATIPNMWLPSINIEKDLQIQRSELITICGNLSKHSITRLDKDAIRIQNILCRNNKSIPAEDAVLAFEDCYEWFHNDILAYHSTKIVELTNNIRWGIFYYLQPEFNRSYKPQPLTSLEKTYSIPELCTDKLSRDFYWNLMNHVRSKPYFPQFKTGDYLQGLY